jgi:uncharacterized membrane protein
VNRREDMIKTLDTLVSCQENLGNFDEAFRLTSELISSFKTSPVGYLRMGKLLRLKKNSTEAAEFYRIGIRKASKRDSLYGILEKQLKQVENLITKNPTVSLSHSPNSNSEICSILFSIPSPVVTKIFKYLSGNTLKNMACTCSAAFKLVNNSILTGVLGRTNLINLKNSQLYSKLLREHCLLERFSHFAILSVSSDYSTLLFLMFLRKLSKNSSYSSRIRNLEIGPLNLETYKIFNDIGLGKNLNSLKIDVSGLSVKLQSDLFISLDELKELHLINYSGFSNHDGTTRILQNLEKLCALNSDEGLNLFYNCSRLKVLIYPNESNIDNFISDKLMCVSIKYKYCNGHEDATSSKPIKYLSLNGKECAFVSKIHLSKYSCKPIEILYLDFFKLSSGINIVNAHWNRLTVLRLNGVIFQDPKMDLMFILKKCRNLRSLELISVPLSNLNDFSSSDNGAWLIESFFSESFSSKLEHLILADLNFGQSALHLLFKNFSSKLDSLLYLKIFAFINIQSNAVGYTTLIDKVFEIVKFKYPWIYLITNNAQYENYNEKFNPFI